MALRGLAYWPGTGGLHPRVFAGNGPYLLALDVTTGKPAPGFGNEGRVDLKKGVLGDLKDGAVRPAIAARRVRRCRHHRLQQRRGLAQRRRLWRHSRLGRADRQAAVDLPHRAAARRTGVGDLACPMPGRIAPARTPGASSPSM